MSYVSKIIKKFISNCFHAFLPFLPKSPKGNLHINLKGINHLGTIVFLFTGIPSPHTSPKFYFEAFPSTTFVLTYIQGVFFSKIKYILHPIKVISNYIHNTHMSLSRNYIFACLSINSEYSYNK